MTKSVLFQSYAKLVISIDFKALPIAALVTPVFKVSTITVIGSEFVLAKTTTKYSSFL